MRPKFFLYPLFLLLLLLALFPKPFLLKALEWKMASLARRECGGNFSFETLSWKNGEILLEKASLCKSGHFEVKVENASFDIFKRKLVLDDVAVTLCKRKEFSLEKFAGILEAPSLHTTIQKGKFLLYDYTNEGEFFQKVDWSYDNSAVVVSCDPNSSPIRLEISSKEDKTEIRAEVSEHKIAPLFSLGRYFFGALLKEPYGSWKFSEGVLSSHFTLVWHEKKCEEIRGNLKVVNLRGQDKALSLLCRLDQLDCFVDFDLRLGVLCNGDFALTNGGISLSQNHPEFWQGLWDLHLFSSDVVVKAGKVVSSNIIANLLGMKGEITLQSRPNEPLLNLSFSGNSKQILPLLPKEIQSSFAIAFPDDAISLRASVKTNPIGVDCEGNLLLADSNGEKNDLLFGCHFGKNDEQLGERPLLANLKDQFLLSSKRVGWFKGNGFRLEKYLSPFLFHSPSSLKLSGIVDFEGSFDDRFCALYYRGKNFAFDSSNFHIYADELKKGISSDVVAVHYFDLTNGDHIGFLPVEKAAYVGKKPVFALEDASFMTYFENRKIEMKEITTRIGDIICKGQMRVDLPKNAPVELQIRTSEIAGGLPSATKFLSTFFPSFFWKFPLQGKVTSGNEGVSLHFLFEPKSKLIAGHVKGKMEAEMKGGFANLSNYSLDFEYDRGANSLLLHDGSGLFSFKNSTVYEIKTPFIKVSDFPDPLVEADVHIGDGQKELYHLSGQYKKGEALAITGNLLTLAGKHTGDQLQIDSFNFGKLSGKAAIDWTGESILLALQDVNICGDSGFSFATKFNRQEKAKWWSLDGLELGLPDETKTYKLDKLHCDFQNQKIKIQEFDFTLPHEKIPLAHSLINSLSKGLIPDTAILHIQNLKKDGSPLSGRLSLEISEEATSVDMHLDDGLYTVFGRDQQLRNLALTYAGGGFGLSGEVFYRDAFYFLESQFNVPKLCEGTIALKENPAAKDALIGFWRKDQAGKIDLHRVEGKFAGLDVFLEGNRTLASGRIHFNALKVSKLLPEGIRSKIEKCRIGGGYTLEGDFYLNDKKFCGLFNGENFSFGGVEFGSLSSVLSLSPQKIECKHLLIEDVGGKAEIENAVMTNDKGKWSFQIPRIKLTEVRPYRLKCESLKKNKKAFFRPLCIQSFEGNHLEGVWGCPETYGGGGEFQFTNIAKKHFLANLLFIPKEITSRIGLDLSLLIPAQGRIRYQIRDGKVYLTKLMDVYSEGKKSRFYLAGGCPATIDFEGNLSMKVKMKQYNLLLKVAELFVVTVKGDIFKPTFTLLNQPDVDETEND